MSTEKKLPLYTRIGFRLTIVLLFIIGVFLARNCSQAVYYGSVTSQESISRMYELGYEHGRMKARQQQPPGPYDGDNAVLKKAYQKGFREGWDSGRSSRK